MSSGIENKDKFKSLPLIKMNKLKLIQIITKDLEELKTLTEEIAENIEDSSLISELALSRARLLSQELELLCSFSPPEDSLKENIEDEDLLEDEDEVSDLIVSDPELEILHFEEHEFPEDNESEEEDDEDIVYDSEDEEDLNEDEGDEELEEDEIPEEEDLTDEADEEEEIDEDFDQEIDGDELEEHELEESDEEDIDLDEEDDESEYEDLEEESVTEEPVQDVETKTVPQPEVREMSMDDLGDDDEEPIQFAPIPDAVNRPVMREIPKPEIQEPEKKAVAETFQKERSLNDVIGENKAEETTLGNGPISSLRAAIGLNDRFLFIREIFNNNTDKFNTVIEQLDKMETIQQAVDYLRVNLTLEKNDTSMRFVDLLKRRFTK
jgi:hypothetical protein